MIAWLFPGQGTQDVGMGKAFYDASPAARAVFERADQALGFSISKLCFDGPKEELTLTKHTQPAILTVSVAVLAALREALPTLPLPVFAAGHSLGEYSALVAAGALSLEDAVKLVHLRGRAMQDAVPEGQGAMAAILGGDAESARKLCEDAAEGEALAPANFNAPGQVVISGSRGAVERASKLAGERKLKAIPLNVSAPFHCSLMAPAARAVEKALGDVAIAPLAFPVISNVEAKPNSDAARVPELLVRQIDGAVLWDQSVSVMAEAGVTRALEIGPGKVLAGLVKRIDKRVSVLSVSDPEALGKVAEFLG
ncbi:MAG TPA: ACP S-malonyltransferase [Polyangiaceae bacterium]|nr:ACP S-malonyltransferase [Polyangiaceae bacterium]